MGGIRAIKWVKRYQHRHGKERLYFRRPGFPTTALAAPIGSAAFLEDYARALAKIPPGHLAKATKTDPKSFRRNVRGAF